MPSLLLLFALAQTSGEAPEVSAEPVQPAPTTVAPAAEKPERRQLDYEALTWCVQLDATTAVPSGRFRVQCDDVKRECLVAPQKVLIDGVEGEEELQRTAMCIPLQDDSRVREKERAGFVFVDAIAEAPDGWHRDERGRIVQVNFDLHRRVYFGGAWAPQYSPNGGFQLGRGRTDFGIEVDLATNHNRELHRLRFLESSVWLGGEPRVDATLVRYSWSALRLSPMFWLTTFVGKPRRFDLDINITGWFEGLRWELVQQQSFLTIAAGAVAVDLWHSKSLESFVRIRLGPSAEYDIQTNGFSLKPFAAVDMDLTLDRDGFHHLTASVSAEKLFFDKPLEGRRTNPARLRLQAGYEVIVLAINDYPLTFLVDARATWRDDIVNVKPGWDFSAHAGLRFSLWAPARRDAGKVSR